MTENYISKEEAIYLVRCIKNKLYNLLYNKNNGSAQDFLANYDEHNNNFANNAYPGRLISAVKAYQDLIKSGIQPKESSGYFIDKYQSIFSDSDIENSVNALLPIPNAFVSRAYNSNSFIYDNSNFSIGGTNFGVNTSTCYLLLNISYKLYNKYQVLRALYFAEKCIVNESYSQQELITAQCKGIPHGNKLPDFKNEILRMELTEFIYGLAISQNAQNYDFEKLDKYSDIFENIAPMYFDNEFDGYRSLFTRSMFSGNDIHLSKFLFMYNKFKELVIDEDFSDIFNYLPDSILNGNSRESYFDKIKLLNDNLRDQVGEFYKVYVLNDNKIDFDKFGAIIVETYYLDTVNNIINAMLSNIDSYINRIDATNSCVIAVQDAIREERTRYNMHTDHDEDESSEQPISTPCYREIVINNTHYYQKRINGRWVPCDEDEARRSLVVTQTQQHEQITMQPVADGTCIIAPNTDQASVVLNNNLNGVELTEHHEYNNANHEDNNDNHINAIHFEHTPIEIEEHEDGTMRATSTLQIPESQAEEAREYLEHLVQNSNRRVHELYESMGDLFHDINIHGIGLRQNNDNVDNESTNRTQPTIHLNDFVYDILNRSAHTGDYQDRSGRTRIDDNGGIHFVR